MNILIPLGGRSTRFVKEGYNTPKSMIQLFDKQMIQYVIDNLHVNETDVIYIIYNNYLEEYGFVLFMNKNYPNVQLIRLDSDTSGAAETLMHGLTYILRCKSYHSKCLVVDCDTFYTDDIVTIFRNSTENMVFYTTKINEPTIYSYIKLDKDDVIVDIAEKNKISDNANTGAYAFININELYAYCTYIVEHKITFNNETYTSCVIKQMIDKHPFKGYELDNKHIFSLGTPTELKQYMNNTHAFMFDLDGTIVLTDEIYFHVWYTILYKYNIHLTDDLFHKYIQGNNDKYVINKLLPQVDINLTELSKEKDDRFIECIHKIKVIDGIEDMMKKIKELGHKCCIVTNCNRTVANEIVKKIGIVSYIDFIICGSECTNGKPAPDPYLTAMKQYNIKNNNCFIFEDSKSGILSGRITNPKCLIGIETLYTPNELINYGVDTTIKNYTNSDELIQLLLNNDSITNVNSIKSIIKDSLLFNISEIIIDDSKLKGGYIADVISLVIKENQNEHHYVLKYENSKVSSLSIMAKQLDLYEREYYFYEYISRHVSIKIPKFIAIIRNDENNNMGILLENLLYPGHFKINLNLSTESIDVSLKIIDSMAKLHASFWNKDLLKIFPKLKKMNNVIFQPFIKNFMSTKMDIFRTKWSTILSPQMLDKCDEIYTTFDTIQQYLSTGNLTFIHGDIKSPNIFYDSTANNEPYFIDWQHCAIGKGAQDLIFFIIESFDITNLDVLYPLFKNYYYKKLIEYNVTNYTFKEYETDLKYSLQCIPFFTAIWFGSTPNDELIDPNFPFFFIKKVCHLMDMIHT
jgi:HAD superfamily hydrolase (TIGR01509 family)